MRGHLKVIALVLSALGLFFYTQAACKSGKGPSGCTDVFRLSQLVPCGEVAHACIEVRLRRSLSILNVCAGTLTVISEDRLVKQLLSVTATLKGSEPVLRCVHQHIKWFFKTCVEPLMEPDGFWAWAASFLLQLSSALFNFMPTNSTMSAALRSVETGQLVCFHLTVIATLKLCIPGSHCSAAEASSSAAMLPTYQS